MEWFSQTTSPRTPDPVCGTELSCSLCEQDSKCLVHDIPFECRKPTCTACKEWKTLSSDIVQYHLSSEQDLVLLMVGNLSSTIRS